MSELDTVIDQIESHAALAREQKLRAEIKRLQECLKGSDMLSHVRGEQIERLRAGNEKLKTEVWHLQAVNAALKIALREARRALEGK